MLFSALCPVEDWTRSTQLRLLAFKAVLLCSQRLWLQTNQLLKQDNWITFGALWDNGGNATADQALLSDGYRATKHLEILVLATTKQLDILNFSMQQTTYSNKSLQLCDNEKNRRVSEVQSLRFQLDNQNDESNKTSNFRLILKYNWGALVTLVILWEVLKCLTAFLFHSYCSRMTIKRIQVSIVILFVGGVVCLLWAFFSRVFVRLFVFVEIRLLFSRPWRKIENTKKQTPNTEKPYVKL